MLKIAAEVVVACGTKAALKPKAVTVRLITNNGGQVGCES